MNIEDCLKRASELELVSESARLDVELLLSHAIERDRTYLYTWPEKELNAGHVAEFDSLLTRRINGEPIAHILGEKEFWSLPLYVDNSTLIPRPDTERLVELALEKINDCKSKSPLILDLGTGTGAIAIALASESSGSSVFAFDNSGSAVALARRNIERHQLTNVKAFQSDWLEYAGIGINPRQSGYDVIVSNPPYIDETDVHLGQGDVRFEPKSALVSGNNGLKDIERIIADAKPFLAPGGWLLIEHGWKQGEAVRNLFVGNSYSNVTVEADLSGNERVTLGCWIG